MNQPREYERFQQKHFDEIDELNRIDRQRDHDDGQKFLNDIIANMQQFVNESFKVRRQRKP